MSERADTLVVGAGLIGSAVAMHLAHMGEDGVVCIDPDLAGVHSSSELNAGGVRATWWQPVNIDLCARTIAYFADHASELHFRPHGYLWLYDPELWRGALAHVALQNRFGREVEELTPAQVARRWSFLDRLEGVAGATFSPHDGLVDPPRSVSTTAGMRVAPARGSWTGTAWWACRDRLRRCAPGWWWTPTRPPADAPSPAAHRPGSRASSPAGAW